MDRYTQDIVITLRVEGTPEEINSQRMFLLDAAAGLGPLMLDSTVRPPEAPESNPVRRALGNSLESCLENMASTARSQPVNGFTRYGLESMMDALLIGSEGISSIPGVGPVTIAELQKAFVQKRLPHKYRMGVQPLSVPLAAQLCNDLSEVPLLVCVPWFKFRYPESVLRHPERRITVADALQNTPLFQQYVDGGEGRVLKEANKYAQEFLKAKEVKST